MKHMKKYIAILFTMFLTFAIYAQSADVTTQILETDEVTFGQVCYLSAVQQGLVYDEASFTDAINVLVENDQIPESAVFEENNVIPLGNIAFILSEMFDIKGGIMYRLTKGSPRYAFKQLKSDGIIPSNASPTDTVSGIALFNMFTSCLNAYTEFDINSVSMENE